VSGERIAADVTSSDKPDQGSWDERRVGPRHKAFLRGRILYNNRQSSIDCTIRDYSPEGARLVSSDAVVVPDAVELEIPHRNEIVPAMVQWRRGGEIGVAFVREKVAAEATAPEVALAERVRKLELEVAEMRRILAALRRSSASEA
jgi:hypothetical protein